MLPAAAPAVAQLLLQERRQNVGRSEREIRKAAVAQVQAVAVVGQAQVQAPRREEQRGIREMTLNDGKMTEVCGY